MARRAIHPGEHLVEEVRELGMSAAALARLRDGIGRRRHQGVIFHGRCQGGSGRWLPAIST